MVPEDRTQLSRRMNTERIRMGKTWEQVAQAVGLSTALLRNVRTGKGPITEETQYKIEQFYGWDDGEVLRLIVPAADPADEEIAEMTSREIAAHALHVERTRGADAKRKWLKHAYAVWQNAVDTLATTTPNDNSK